MAPIKKSILSLARMMMSIGETVYVVTPNGRRLDARPGSTANVVNFDHVDGFGVVSAGPRLRIELMINQDSTLAAVREGLALAWPQLMNELRRAQST